MTDRTLRCTCACGATVGGPVPAWVTEQAGTDDRAKIVAKWGKGACFAPRVLARPGESRREVQLAAGRPTGRLDETVCAEAG